MPLTENTPRDYQVGDQESYPVAGSVEIYEGAAVGENGAGYSRPLQAGDVFQGFAIDGVDNTDGVAGSKRVDVKKRGNIVLPITGITVTANDRPAVYASDDATFTLTAGANSLIGYVARWQESGVAVVEFDAALARAALQA